MSTAERRVLRNGTTECLARQLRPVGEVEVAVSGTRHGTILGVFPLEPRIAPHLEECMNSCGQ